MVVEVVMSTVVVEAVVNGRTVVCDDYQQSSKLLYTNDSKHILNRKRGMKPCR